MGTRHRIREAKDIRIKGITIATESLRALKYGGLSIDIRKLRTWKYVSLIIETGELRIEQISGSCLMPSEHFFSYIMAITSYFSMT